MNQKIVVIDEKRNSGFFSQTIGRIRKNHALEHATIHVLSEKFPHKKVGGYSMIHGFWLMTDISLTDVSAVAQEAKDRLNSGEIALAIHPNCGTNLSVTALLFSFGALAVLAGTKSNRERFARFSDLASISCLAALGGPTLGNLTQKYLTTDANMTGIQIVGVEQRAIQGQSFCFVQTQAE